MADVQSNFKTFHDKIKLSDNNENAKLRDKREIIVNALRNGLKEHAEDTGQKLTFTHFNQGSYALGTGITPRGGDYDIDVGIVFNHTEDEFDDAIELKTIVRDALDTHGRTVKIRRPCVTVTYLKNGETDYHVDLAIYVETSTDDLNLAVGRELSADDQIYWELCDPKGQIEEIKGRHTGENGKQYRRCTRFLKKWRDHKFSGSGAPISIGLTCSAYTHFSPTTFGGQYSDLRAMKAMVTTMLNAANAAGRVVATLPTRPWNDVFGEMTTAQMGTFIDKLGELEDALVDARDEDSVKEACKILKRQFGPDFEVPEDDPGKKSGPSGTAKTSAASPVIPAGSQA